jgi:hypothetical protein
MADVNPDELEVSESVTSALARNVQDKFEVSKSLRVLQEVVWKEALQNFNGTYGSDVTFREGASSVFVNLTQMKTMAAYSRLMAVMMPPAGYPWAIKPTPHPELVKLGMKPEAALASPEMSPEFKQVLSQAKAACDGMQNRIKDNLVETRWEEKFSRGVLDLVTFGTMIFKGPLAAPAAPKKWVLVDQEESFSDKLKGLIGIHQKQQKYVLVSDSEDDSRADLEWVSPFEFYPDPAAYTISDAMWAIHRHVFNKNQMVELAEGDFDAEEINLVLNEIQDGNWSAEPWESGVDIINRRSASMQMGKRYIVFEFWGYLSGRELKTAGHDVPDGDLNKMHLSNVWVCGNHCIKITVSNRANGKLPFFVVPYEKVPYKIWGRGVPEKMADPQAIINASARAMVENMGISCAPQLVVDVNRLVDGTKYDQIVPWGIWPVKNMEGASQEPVQFKVIPSIMGDLKLIQDIFRNFVQEVTSMPDMASGFAGNGQHNRTAGGMSMLFGAADSYTRGVVFNIDNDLTKPMIRALYDWEMQYNPDMTIKGDMQVDAGGVTGLMNKEMATQKIAEVFAALGQIPGSVDYINMAEVAKEIFRGLDIVNDNIVYSDEEVQKIRAQNQQQQVQQAEKMAQVQNVPKPKAETTPPDMMMQVLEKTIPTDPIYPIIFEKWLAMINQLDPQSVAALDMMKHKNVLENKAFADQQELAVLQQDIEMASQINASNPQGSQVSQEPEPEPPPQEPPTPPAPPMMPNIHINIPNRAGKHKFTQQPDGTMLAESVE